MVEQAQQAHYIKWCELTDIEDPCGGGEWQQVLVIMVSILLTVVTVVIKFPLVSEQFEDITSQ